MPPPTHIVTTAYFALRRRPSISAWPTRDRKSTRLNSSHGYISYAVFCLKKKKKKNIKDINTKKKTEIYTISDMMYDYILHQGVVVLLLSDVVLTMRLAFVTYFDICTGYC